MALMELVMVVDGFSRAYKSLIAGYRYCEGLRINISNPSCVVVT